ncbi:hypothetical protein [Noviluteimonas dokdonensis]|uniref:hypothetical protein n=1 Tax=Noviluteimonas dokdonensis TaxID=414050 RepID=UPI001269AC9E|nr:hypothetical protein [Lysobacter dokdonensis]
MTIPNTLETLRSTLERAIKAGSDAAQAEVVRLAKIRFTDACGGSLLILDVDGRTAFGRILSAYQQPGVQIRKGYEGGFVLNLPYQFDLVPPVTGQDQAISVAADEAALRVIQQELGIKGYVRPYIS